MLAKKGGSPKVAKTSLNCQKGHCIGSLSSLKNDNCKVDIVALMQ